MSKNVSLIHVIDLFNMPITLRPPLRERGARGNRDRARGCKNHSYIKCNRMAQLCPRPTLKEACHSPCVTTSDLEGASRNGERDSGQPAILQLPVSCAGKAPKRLLWSKSLPATQATAPAIPPLDSFLWVKHCSLYSVLFQSINTLRKTVIHQHTPENVFSGGEMQGC